MTPTLEIALFVLGFVGAFVSGLVGVGGAIVMIPLLYYVPPLLGVGSLTIKAVAGLTMTQVLAAAAVGAWRHGRRALVHRGLALTGGAAMAAGSLAGAVLALHVSGRALLVVFALMTTIGAAAHARATRPRRRRGRGSTTVRPRARDRISGGHRLHGRAGRARAGRSSRCRC